MALIDGVVSVYAFNGNAIDSHGTNHGTATGASFVSSGQQLGSGCASFANAGDKVTLPMGDVGDTFTISTWSKTTNIVAERWIFGGSGVTTNRYPDIFYHTNGCIYFRGGETEIGVNTSPTTYAVGVWSHIVVIADGTDRKLFVNGVYKAQSTEATNPVFYTTSQVGLRGDDTSPMLGLIDETVIWDKAMDFGGVALGEVALGEVAELWNHNVGAAYPFRPVAKSNGGGSFVQSWLLLVKNVISGVAQRVIELSNVIIRDHIFKSPHVQITGDFRAKVVKVHDGDTVTLRASFRSFDFPLRLANINALELGHGGEFARDYLKDKILGKDVLVVINPDNRVGRYGRLIGEIVCGGFNVGEDLVRRNIAIRFGSKNHRIESKNKWLKEAKNGIV